MTTPAARILRVSDVDGTWSISVRCPHCGHPLLFTTPGRDICERCRLDNQKETDR